MPSDPAVDPVILGANIAHARKRSGKTQLDLANALGISRQVIVAIESGQRPPGELVLVAIADYLGSSVRDLVSLGPPDPAMALRFRTLRGGEQKAQAAFDALEDYGRRYMRLETLAKDRIVRREAPPYSLDRPGSSDRIAEELASTERLRLGLGDGPLPDLRVVFEEDSGLRIFGLDELRKTKISGLFIYSRDYGGLIGFNAGHDPRRIRWTLCHEYAHYLTERYEPEVTPEHESGSDSDEGHPRTGRSSRIERFANAFAARFLMPATGLSRRFSEMLGDAGGEIKVAHLVMLAQFFDVSFQAVTQRLEEIGRVTRGTYAMLSSRGFKPREAEKLLGIERYIPLDRLPFRYIFLVARLYARGELSEGDVATYLKTDRLTVREILQRVPEAGDDGDETEPGLDTPIGVAS